MLRIVARVKKPECAVYIFNYELINHIIKETHYYSLILGRAVNSYLIEKKVFPLFDFYKIFEEFYSKIEYNNSTHKINSYPEKYRKKGYPEEKLQYHLVKSGIFDQFFADILPEFPYLDKEYAASVFSEEFDKLIKTEYGVKFGNIDTKYFKTSNGIRRTYYQPEKYTNHIFFVGNCNLASGFGVEDKLTIPSLLQYQLSQIDELKEKYKCVNLGVRGQTTESSLELILTLPLREGDIIILSASHSYCNYNINSMQNAISNNYIENYRRLSMLDKPYMFPDPGHHFTTPYANSMAADSLLLAIKEISDIDWSKHPTNNNEAESKNVYTRIINRIKRRHNAFHDRLKNLEGLKQYLESLPSPLSGETGSIVMNCNPFTLGHLYLIEYACSQVDRLIIFVVEEDKSFFKFKDRIELIKLGVSHLSNVTVIPSGNFIISTKTMPGYFNKDVLQETTLDASLDLNIFCRYIAPAMNITRRFAGEEPKDKFTQQYNEQMKEILPNFGIKFTVIPRKEFDNKVISASVVREKIKNNDKHDLDKFVPATTLDFLLKNYYH